MRYLTSLLLHACITRAIGSLSSGTTHGAVEEVEAHSHSAGAWDGQQTHIKGFYLNTIDTLLRNLRVVQCGDHQPEVDAYLNRLRRLKKFSLLSFGIPGCWHRLDELTFEQKGWIAHALDMTGSSWNLFEHDRQSDPLKTLFHRVVYFLEASLQRQCLREMDVDCMDQSAFLNALTRSDETVQGLALEKTVWPFIRLLQKTLGKIEDAPEEEKANYERLLRQLKSYYFPLAFRIPGCWDDLIAGFWTPAVLDAALVISRHTSGEGHQTPGQGQDNLISHIGKAAREMGRMLSQTCFEGRNLEDLDMQALYELLESLDGKTRGQGELTDLNDAQLPKLDISRLKFHERWCDTDIVLVNKLSASRTEHCEPWTGPRKVTRLAKDAGITPTKGKRSVIGFSEEHIKRKQALRRVMRTSLETYAWSSGTCPPTPCYDESGEASTEIAGRRVRKMKKFGEDMLLQFLELERHSGLGFARFSTESLDKIFTFASRAGPIGFARQSSAGAVAILGYIRDMTLQLVLEQPKCLTRADLALYSHRTFPRNLDRMLKDFMCLRFMCGRSGESGIATLIGEARKAVDELEKVLRDMCFQGDW